MANSIAYTIPTIGATPDPTWEANINAALQAIATHTHDGVNAGAILFPTAISFASSGFNFGNMAQTNAAYFDVAQQASLPAQASGHGRLACDTTGNLYYVSPTANVLLATTAAINYSSAAKGFAGADYGTTGGSAVYNTSNTAWPYNTAFYLYSGTGTPTDDTGTRAAIGTGLIHIKGASGTACGTYYTDSSNGTVERPYFGITATSLSYGEIGLSVGRTASGTACVAFIARETETSQNFANNAPVAARTYGLHINGSPSQGTAHGFYHYSIRGNVANVGNAGISDLGYIVRNYTDASGNAVAPADGFGLRHRWHLQSGTTLGIGTPAAATQVAWANVTNLRGRYSVFLGAANSFLGTPGIDLVANSAGSTSVGIAQSADYSGVSCLIGLNTTITGTLTTSGSVTIQSGGLAINGGNLAIPSGGITSAGGITAASLAVTGALSTGLGAAIGNTLTVAATATIGAGLTVGSTLSVGSASTFGGVITAPAYVANTNYTAGAIDSIWRNTRVVAWGVVQTSGVATGVNVNSGSGIWTANTCVVTLLHPVDAACVVFVQAFGSGATSGQFVGAYANLASTTQIQVTTYSQTGGTTAYTSQGFYFVIIGGA